MSYECSGVREGFAIPTTEFFPSEAPTDFQLFNSLWIGERLSSVERACLRSFVRHGHRFTLWCYDEPDGIPDGIVLRDAREILPADQIVRYRSGSVSLFSNRFRYEIQRRSLGIWVDTDIYLVRPVPVLPQYAFAWQSGDRLGTAVLRLPPEGPLLEALLDVFAERSVPSWLPVRERLAAHARLLRTGKTNLAQMAWGTSGPLALTHFCSKLGLDQHALPSDMFFPVHWSRAEWILDPSIKLESVITERTVGIHLWNELIKDQKSIAAPSGSFLARLQSEGAVDVPAEQRARAFA